LNPKEEHKLILMEIAELIKIGTIFFLGSTLMSMVGFGFSLFVIPVLLFMGIDLPQAVMMSLISSIISKLYPVISFRHEVNWKKLTPFILTTVISLPLGIHILYRVSFLEPDVVKAIIGICVLLLLFLQWFQVFKPRDYIAAGWGYVASLFSGILTGFANIGGPPLVLWILAHNWPNKRMRSTSLIITLASAPLQIILMVAVFGSIMGAAILKAVILIPFILLGSHLGVKAGNTFSPKTVRLCMQILLLIIALGAIIKPLLKG